METSLNLFQKTDSGILNVPTQEQVDCHAPKAILRGSSQHPSAGLPHWQPCYCQHAYRVNAMCGRRLPKAITAIFQDTGENVQGTIGGLANSYSQYCATYENTTISGTRRTLYGPHIQEFSRTSIPLTRPSPTPESAEATASATPGPTWFNLLLHHQSKLHGELCSRERFVIKVRFS